MQTNISLGAMVTKVGSRDPRGPLQHRQVAQDLLLLLLWWKHSTEC